MSSFDDRKNVFENKFALDEALMFKAEARCCKIFGLWLGEQLGFDEDTANTYAGKVIAANLEEPGFDDVKRFVMPDIQEKNLPISDADLDQKLAELFVSAQEQIKAEAE